MSRNKARGTKAESDVRGYLRENGWPHARRLALAGARDEGDIRLGDGIPVTIEVKDCAKYELSTWLAEAHAERDTNGDDIAAVWFKRRGKGNPQDWFVLMDGETFVTLLRRGAYGLDEPDLAGWTPEPDELDGLSQDPLVNDRPSFDQDAYYDGRDLR